MNRWTRASLVALAFTGTGTAQNLNIDFTYNMARTAPAPSYGAAMNQPGVWNAWDAASPLSPVDLSGAATSVVITIVGPASAGLWDDPATVGDDERLIDDYIVVGHDLSTATTITFQNLAPGLYETYTYGWFPNSWYILTCVFNAASVDPQDTCGGTWGGTLATTPQAWARHRQWVGAGGSLSVQAFGSQGQGGLNGIQVRHTPNAYITSYCTGKLNSAGCVPLMSHHGYPSVADHGYYSLDLRAYYLVPQKPGLLMYGLGGPAAIPFQGGTLCMAMPVRRTPGQSSGGTPPGCNGGFDLHFIDFVSGSLGGNPHPALLVPGTIVNCQWWARDSGLPPNNSQLSNAVEFVLGF